MIAANAQEMLFARADLYTLQLEALETVAKAKERFRPVATFALFSGGNDSTAMVHLVRGAVDAAVHINTGIGVPQTTEFVRALCDQLSLPLIELRTDPSVYRDIVLGESRKGFPGPAFHYITYHRLKSERLQELQRDQSRPKQRILFVSGVRSSESARRMKNIAARRIDPPRGRLSRCAWANPIVDFDVAHLAEYRASNGVAQNEVAMKLGRSGECLCGAFARPDELEQIADSYPDVAAYIRAMEREAEQLGKPYSRWGWGQDQSAPAPGPLCHGCSMRSPDLLFGEAQA